MDITNLITNLGFPIACVVGLAVFIARIWSQNEKNSLERELSYREIIKTYNEQLQKNNQVLFDISKILDEICNRIEDIEKKTK